jgi:hypothetical protein
LRTWAPHRSAVLDRRHGGARTTTMSGSWQRDAAWGGRWSARRGAPGGASSSCRGGASPRPRSAPSRSSCARARRRCCRPGARARQARRRRRRRQRPALGAPGRAAGPRRPQPGRARAHLGRGRRGGARQGERLGGPRGGRRKLGGGRRAFWGLGAAARGALRLQKPTPGGGGPTLTRRLLRCADLTPNHSPPAASRWPITASAATSSEPSTVTSTRRASATSSTCGPGVGRVPGAAGRWGRGSARGARGGAGRRRG